jgi:CBS domain-containing protein
MNDMALEMSAGTTLISALVSNDLVRFPADSSLLELGRALADANVGLVILAAAGDSMVGVVSERDLVRALADGRDPGKTSGREIASTELAWCDTASTVAEVAEEMMERYIRHVLVEEDGRLVGVVSARDLLGVYVAADMCADEPLT